MSLNKRIFLVGNPNSGKTTLFNQLTGLNQQTGNYPGVTVEKKTGSFKHGNIPLQVVDLPGTYSLYPTSIDESVVIDQLLTATKNDLVLVVTDVQALERGLLLFSQVQDLGCNVVLVPNMIDKLDKTLNTDLLKTELNTDVFPINATKKGSLSGLFQYLKTKNGKASKQAFSGVGLKAETFEKLGLNTQQHATNYAMWHALLNQINENPLAQNKRIAKAKLIENGISVDVITQQDSLNRYSKIRTILKHNDLLVSKALKQTNAIDKVLLHPVFGYVFFLGLLFIMFQLVFSLANYPMDFIDGSLASLAEWCANILPASWLTDLLIEGIIPGITGVVIFIPQIAFLFLFIAILEQSGYMARAVFLSDKFMSLLGLNGKSIVPLISGVACSIPAVMAARTIGNYKERLITILVTPFITCAARLPVYVILIALIVPAGSASFGVFNAQGLVLFAMYFLGFAVALLAAVVLNRYVKTGERSKLALELPTYKLPNIKNVGLTIYQKTKSFVVSAGKIIFVLSIVIWVLSSYGVGYKFNHAQDIVTEQMANETDAQVIEQAVAAYKLEHSFAGVLGKAIEPAIKPLGYDWKIGIALLTSFAAREVFVGTIATIYSVGANEEDTLTIKNRLQTQINRNTNQPTFNFATCISLLLFYAFAMQCLSTLAVVKQETNSWKWPLVQLVGMSGLAYVCALLAYQFLR